MKNDLQNTHKELLNMMILIHKLFTENNIKYSLEAGSALGAIRSGGFIPWDNDIDITVPYSEANRITELLKETPEFIPDHGLKNKNSLIMFSRLHSKKNRRIFVDIVPYIQSNNPRPKLLFWWARLKWFRNYEVWNEENKKLKPFFIFYSEC